MAEQKQGFVGDSNVQGVLRTFDNRNNFCSTFKIFFFSLKCFIVVYVTINNRYIIFIYILYHVNKKKNRFLFCWYLNNENNNYVI